jgi:hypothetical protein
MDPRLLATLNFIHLLLSINLSCSEARNIDAVVQVSCYLRLKSTLVGGPLPLHPPTPTQILILQMHPSPFPGNSEHAVGVQILELMEGGDLRGALSGPLAEFNSWVNNGHVLAMDIVRGVFYLHGEPTSFHAPLLRSSWSFYNL